MPVLVDLINQVQKILPRLHGGTGNDFGAANEMLMVPYMNDTGAVLPLGTLVRLLGSYDDRRVQATTLDREQATVGVVVGRYSAVAATLDEFEEVAPDHAETVAVCVAGRCKALVASAVNIGEFAYASGSTAGSAFSSIYIEQGAIGQFESSTAGAGTAWLRLFGGPSTPGMVGAIVAVLGDGATTLQVNTMGDVVVPFNLTLTSVTMLSTTSGSCVIDIYSDTYGNFPPTGADSITGAAPPTITTGVKSQDATLTGWTTALTGGTTLRFNVESASSLTQVTVQLAFVRR